MKISDIAIKRPVTTITLVAAILIFGSIALSDMGIELNPEVDLPVISVSTSLTGASPEIIDQAVTDVVETQINTLSGIRSIRSQSLEGRSQITVEFDLDKDIDVAAEEVRGKAMRALGDLPEDASEPNVEKVDVNAEPIIWLAVSGDVPKPDLIDFTKRQVTDQLRNISGIGDTQTSGYEPRNIRVWLDNDKLEAYDLTADEVTSTIQNNHLELPSGRIERSEIEYSIKVLGEFETIDELRNLVVKEESGGRVLLEDVATVEEGLDDLRSIANYNGVPTVGVGIAKQAGANTVDVAENIRERLKEIQANTPEGITIEIASDNSEFIERSVSGVRTDIIFGVIMTSIIMLIFLRNFRTTFISIVTIPVALIGAFTVIYALGFTINNLTMLAISLGIGMVIDDTIVVMENIFRRFEDGEERMEAARKGTGEVGLAVLASTGSIIAVFLPVAFMEGIIGRFFYQFAMTVAVTVIISTITALTLTPFLCSRILKHQKKNYEIFEKLEGFFVLLEKKYFKAISWVVQKKKLILGIAFGAFLAGIALVPFLGSEFITEADESRFIVQYELPTGSSLDKTQDALYEMESIVFEYPEVTGVFSTIGAGGFEAVNQGTFIISLNSPYDRSASQAEIMERVRRDFTESIDEITLSVSALSSGIGGTGGGGQQGDVTYTILGPDINELSELTYDVVRQLESQEMFASIDTDLRLNRPDNKVYINRDLANALGVDVRSISNEFNAIFGGRDVAEFREDGYSYDIRIRAQPEFRDEISDMETVNVRNRSGELVKAANLVDIVEGEGPNVINRTDRMLSVTIYADMAEGFSAGEGLETVEQTVTREIPSEGIWDTRLGGESEVFRDSVGSLMTALILAILIIYMVLSMQFESFIHPFTIMVSLPLTLIGVIGALMITGMTLNIYSIIGLIMLMGLVTKNAILLVDFANQARKKGKDKVEAIKQAGLLRLRPILMTAVSTIIAVVPVALAISEGGEARAPMAVAIIGGMITSTFLTLLVVPVVYLLMDNGAEWIRKKFAHVF
ncbi:MAG: efflux RND transporter permease subunit [Gracilimonas sp.]